MNAAMFDQCVTNDWDFEMDKCKLHLLDFEVPSGLLCSETLHDLSSYGNLIHSQLIHLHGYTIDGNMVSFEFENLKIMAKYLLRVESGVVTAPKASKIYDEYLMLYHPFKFTAMPGDNIDIQWNNPLYVSLATNVTKWLKGFDPPSSKEITASSIDLKKIYNLLHSLESE